MASANYFDLIVSLAGLLTNLLALEAVVHGNFSLAGYRRFLISLLLSDLCICTVNILLFGLQTVSEYGDIDNEAYKCLAEVGRSLEIISLTANLLNLCGMSVDHFIGIVYPLKYRYISHGSVAKAAVFIIWALAFIIGFADYPLRILAYTYRKVLWSSELNPDVDISNMNNNCSNVDATSLFKSSNMPLSSNNTATKHTNNTTTTFENPQEEFKLELFSISELNYIFTSVLNSSLADDPCVNISKLRELQRQHSPEVDDGSHVPVSWCAYFDGRYKVWLEIIVMSLSLISLIFLSACYGRVFRAAVVKADKSKQKLRKLVFTTILLLGTFTLCWIPFVLYEVIMVLILRWAITSINSSSAESFFIAHNILHSLCITCSPLLVPIIYAARIRVVQQRIVERYGCLIPASWKQLLTNVSFRQSEVSQPEAIYLTRQPSSPLDEVMFFRPNGKAVGERLHHHGYCSRENIAALISATRTTSIKEFSRNSESFTDEFVLLNKLASSSSKGGPRGSAGKQKRASTPKAFVDAD